MAVRGDARQHVIEYNHWGPKKIEKSNVVICNIDRWLSDNNQFFRQVRVATDYRLIISDGDDLQWNIGKWHISQKFLVLGRAEWEHDTSSDVAASGALMRSSYKIINERFTIGILIWQENSL